MMYYSYWLERIQRQVINVLETFDAFYAVSQSLKNTDKLTV